MKYLVLMTTHAVIAMPILHTVITADITTVIFCCFMIDATIITALLLLIISIL